MCFNGLFFNYCFFLRICTKMGFLFLTKRHQWCGFFFFFFCSFWIFTKMSFLFVTKRHQWCGFFNIYYFHGFHFNRVFKYWGMFMDFSCGLYVKSSEYIDISLAKLGESVDVVC